MKLWYLTRSYHPYQKGGGPLLRKGQVDFLEKLSYDVTVITPHYSSLELKKENDVILIAQSYNIKLALYLERLGFYEDYLDKWVVTAFDYLKNKITKDDVVFATSGGELGMIKLGSMLKEEIGCKFVINFHDPLDYSIVNNLVLNKKFHTSREKQEKKYLVNSDLIITSSKVNQNSLQSKYPYLKEKIINNYFGYIEKLIIQREDRCNEKLRVAYVGNMGSLQKPEILYDIYKKMDNKENIELYFIGDISSNIALKKIKEMRNPHIKFIDFLPHSEFLEFMNKNIDVGFVSLISDYLGACVPSKIYEYINLELPIIGALAEGDGKDIINDNMYGIACNYNDINGLVEALKLFKNRDYLKKVKLKIQADKDKWFMEETIKDVDKYLRAIHAKKIDQCVVELPIEDDKEKMQYLFNKVKSFEY